MQEFKDGKHELSVITTQTIESLSTDEKQTWRTIRKELEEIGISLAAFEANKAFILEWFKDGIKTGAFEEQALEDDPSSVSCHNDSHQSLEYLDTTASEYVPQWVLPPRSKDAKPLDPSQTRLQSNWTTQHPGVADWRTSDQGSEFKNSSSQVNDQTCGVEEFISSQSSINCKALPLRPQDGETQISPQAALHPDVASEPVIEDAQATQLLLEGEPDVTARDSDEWIALHNAAEGGDEPLVRLLLEAGVDVATKDRFKWTALHKAAKSGHKTVVQLLLEKGADVTGKDHIGRTALHRAAENGHETVVRLLLEKEANITAKDDVGRTALYWAAENGHEAVVRLLLEEGADVAAKDKVGRMALHRTAEKGQEAAMRLLLDRKADVSAKDNFGRTALHWAAENGHEAVVWLLLENGADVVAKDNAGRTALDWAAGNAQEAMVQLLTTLTEDSKSTVHGLSTKDHESHLPFKGNLRFGLQEIS